MDPGCVRWPCRPIGTPDRLFFAVAGDHVGKLEQQTRKALDPNWIAAGEVGDGSDRFRCQGARLPLGQLTANEGLDFFAVKLLELLPKEVLLQALQPSDEPEARAGCRKWA